MLLGRLVGWIVTLLGFVILVEWFFVPLPMIVKSSFILEGVVMIIGGAILVYLFRNRKKSIE